MSIKKRKKVMTVVNRHRALIEKVLIPKSKMITESLNYIISNLIPSF
jgi:hypothetical protein